MSNTIYKQLFEIRILHDYFLTTEAGDSFFNKSQDEKKELLNKKLNYGLYDVKNMFDIKPLENSALSGNPFRLVWKTTSLGLIVGTEVSVEIQAGETLYRPELAPKDLSSFTFSLRPKVSSFRAMTNLRFQSPLPARYRFTNVGRSVFEEPSDASYKSLPLSESPLALQEGKAYEMGTILNWPDKLKQAIQYTDGSNQDHWENVDDRRFVTEADRMLLPRQFTYTSQNQNGIKKLKAVLMDASENEIKTIQWIGETPQRHIPLQFLHTEEGIPEPIEIPEGKYQLKLTEDSEPEVTYSIVMDDSGYSTEDLGIIQIEKGDADSPFGLLDTSGFLITKIKADNVKVSHPIFEIRFQNRKTYWRYQKEKDRDFSEAEKTAATGILKYKSKKLVSLAPKGLTSVLTPYGNGISLPLPPPKSPTVKPENGKFFSEILLATDIAD